MLHRVENCKLLPCIYRVILVSVVTTLETALPRNRGSIPGRGEIFRHTKFRPEMGPTQSLVRWVLGILLRGQSGQTVNVTTYLHLVPR